MGGSSQLDEHITSKYEIKRKIGKGVSLLLYCMSELITKVTIVSFIRETQTFFCIVVEF